MYLKELFTLEAYRPDKNNWEVKLPARMGGVSALTVVIGAEQIIARKVSFDKKTGAITLGQKKAIACDSTSGTVGKAADLLRRFAGEQKVTDAIVAIASDFAPGSWAVASRHGEEVLARLLRNSPEDILDTVDETKKTVLLENPAIEGNGLAIRLRDTNVESALALCENAGLAIVSCTSAHWSVLQYIVNRHPQALQDTRLVMVLGSSYFSMICKGGQWLEPTFDPSIVMENLSHVLVDQIGADTSQTTYTVVTDDPKHVADVFEGELHGKSFKMVADPIEDFITLAIASESLQDLRRSVLPYRPHLPAKYSSVMVGAEIAMAALLFGAGGVYLKAATVKKEAVVVAARAETTSQEATKKRRELEIAKKDEKRAGLLKAWFDVSPSTQEVILSILGAIDEDAYVESLSISSAPGQPQVTITIGVYGPKELAQKQFEHVRTKLRQLKWESADFHRTGEAPNGGEVYRFTYNLPTH